MKTKKRRAPAWVYEAGRLQEIKGISRNEAIALRKEILASGKTVDDWCREYETVSTQVVNAGTTAATNGALNRMRVAETCEMLIGACGGNFDVARQALANAESLSKLTNPTT